MHHVTGKKDECYQPRIIDCSRKQGMQWVFNSSTAARNSSRKNQAAFRHAKQVLKYRMRVRKKSTFIPVARRTTYLVKIKNLVWTGNKNRDTREKKKKSFSYQNNKNTKFIPSPTSISHPYFHERQLQRTSGGSTIRVAKGERKKKRTAHYELDPFSRSPLLGALGVACKFDGLVTF